MACKITSILPDGTKKVHKEVNYKNESTQSAKEETNRRAADKNKKDKK